MRTNEQLIKIFESCKNGRRLNQLHSLAIKTGLTHDTSFAAKLIELYSRLTPIRTAHKLFDEIPNSTGRIWNGILQRYCRDKRYEESLLLFSKFFSSEKTDLCSICIALRACAALRALGYGKIIHGFVGKTDFIRRDLFIRSALVELYSKCGEMDDALYVFDEFPEQDTVLWTAMITGYQRSSKPTQALEFFTRMAMTKGVMLDSIALISVVSVCTQILDLKAGRSVHGYMIRAGFESSLSLSNALLTLYGKMGSVNTAANLFEKMPERDVISWGSMMTCYAHNGCAEEALNLFDEMSARGITPNTVIFISALQACETARNLDTGKRIHELAMEKGFDSDILVSTSLINMYMNCKSPDDAVQVFDKMPCRDAFCFSSMLHGCVENGLQRKSIKIFRDMLGNNFRPGIFDMVKILTVCSELGVFQETSCVHGFATRSGLADNILTCASLIESYAKCGSLDCAVEIFQQTLKRDVVIWSAMLAAYGFHGKGQEALQLFNQMVEDSSVRPNEVSFVSVLSACSHAGLVREGIDIFEEMIENHGVKPKLKHYRILVDLLGRAGELEKAVGFIGRIQEPVGADVWGALLNACVVYQNVEIGEMVAKKVLDLNGCDAGHYMLVCNMYGGEEKWDDVAGVRELVRHRKLKKVLGQSVVQR